MPDDFGDQILEAYPKLKLFALSRASHPSDADDLVQSTIERALEKRAQFTGGSLIAWMITIAKNLHADLNKAAYKRLRNDNPLDEGSILSVAGISSQESNTMLKQVVDIIDRLGGRCKELLLFSAQGYKTREIAVWLKIPEGTAMRNMFECRQKLHEAMGGEK